MHLIEPSPPRLPCTFMRLRRLSRRVSALYDRHLAQVGLRATQYALLMHVPPQGAPIGELAARLVMDRTTLTRNLKPLLAAGLLEERSGVDARVRQVRLTGAGRRRLAQAQRAWAMAQSELEQALGEPLAARLNETLDRGTLLLAESDAGN